jgi:hypothetical protein
MKKNLFIFALFFYSAALAQVNVIPIGSSGSAFSVAFGSRTNLWYDSVLNSIVFVHRSTIGINGSTTIDDIRYDYSTNGGLNWQINKGPVYATDGTHLGRFPQGVIYNPVGNTIPDSAFATCYGPITDNTNWVANYEGTTQIGSSTNKKHLYPTTVGGGKLNDVIPGGMQIIKNTGVNWVVAIGSKPPAFSGGGQYTNDSIFLAKGTYSSGDFSYDFTHTFYAPVIDSVGGIADISTAWSDDGMVGYVVRLVNDHNHFPPLSGDSVYVPQVWKTIDGGNTWVLKTTDSTNMNINLLHNQIPNAGSNILTTGFNVDCAVDKNNNLHIAVAVGGSGGNYAINSSHGEWGIFDIYTTDGGDTWCGQLIAMPEYFIKIYGNPIMIEESNRQQASRSWDGSKIFITWFDSDTAGTDSLDMYSRGYDVDNELWTDTVNLTKNTAAEGQCDFGCVSYYVKQNGADYCIPTVITKLQSNTCTGCVVSYNYIDGACLSNFNQPSMCAPLSVAEINVSNTLIKIYPNPLTSSSILELSESVRNAEVIIYDMVGKELLRKQLTGNKTEIKKGTLENGVYLMKVVTRERQYVQKLIVQ